MLMSVRSTDQRVFVDLETALMYVVVIVALDADKALNISIRDAKASHAF